LTKAIKTAEALVNGQDKVAFNQSWLTGAEETNIRAVLEGSHLHGDGGFTRKCQELLSRRIGGEALLTGSCTAALDMAAILCDLGPGDEVILPSYTFSSTANAIALRGATPVFVDIRADTLNIDENAIEAAITERTRAISVVHYAGVCAEMDVIAAIAQRHGLKLVEDAAQALGSTYRGRAAGSFGDMSCFSFHASKNIVSGEGGALIVNRKELAERAHIIWEKGTNRREFIEGRVDKYTWVDIGSSFLPSEITAAFLLAQLEHADQINDDRLKAWTFYHSAFEKLERSGRVVRPTVPDHCTHNGHIYYLLLKDREDRDRLTRDLAEDGITAPFHYIPLHSAPAGLRFGRTHGGNLPVTDEIAARLIRLPLYAGIGYRAEIVAERVLAHLARP
jgi:dTDP-4-amino-4,6-dideoxygalactose transaminase